jgi:hypothetical protein
MIPKEERGMTTEAKLEANRTNALLSTGPRTPAGKGQSAKNALRHGLRSVAPVLPGESAEEWEAHRAGVLESLAPQGALENCLAERVALSLWRLRRAAAYETAVTVAGLEEVPEDVRASTGTGWSDDHDLQEALKKADTKRQALDAGAASLRVLEALPEAAEGAPVGGEAAEAVLSDLSAAVPGETCFEYEDADFLAGLGVPDDELDNPWGWDGWTAGMLGATLATMAKAHQTTADKILARATQDRRQAQEDGRAELRQLEREAKDLRRSLRAREERLRLRRMLPDGTTLEKLTRYEAHLHRQMMQALHELERLQAARSGEAVPPPAALDVTVDAPEKSILALGDGAGGA